MSYNFTHIKGDTFEQVPFAILLNNALSLTSVSSAGITITNAAGGLFKINKQIIDIAAGNYSYDLEIKFADNTVKTWLSGEFLIECDITR